MKDEWLLSSAETGKDNVFEDILIYAGRIQACDQSQFPSPEEIIRQMREARDVQFIDC